MENELVKKGVGLFVGILVGGIVISIVQGFALKYLIGFVSLDANGHNDYSDASVIGLLAMCFGTFLGVWAANAIALKISGGWKFIVVLIGILFLIGCLLTYMKLNFPFWYIIPSAVAVILGIAFPIRRMKD